MKLFLCGDVMTARGIDQVLPHPSDPVLHEGYVDSALGYVRLAWAIFILSILVHAWVGMRSIYLDYLHPLWLRFSVTLFTAFGLLALGLWAAQILLA